MRVAVIGHTYILDANRGKFRHLNKILGGLLLIVPDRWDEKDFGARAFEKSETLTIRPLPVIRSGHVRRYCFNRSALFAALSEFKPDLIHVEAEAGSRVARQAAKAALALQIPLTQFVWENIPAESFFGKLLIRANFRTVRLLFCGSKGAEETARADSYGGPTAIIPQVGVDLAFADAVLPSPALTGGPFTVGVVSRLDEKKGVASVIEAVARLELRNVALAIVGDGPQRGLLEELAKKNGSADRVRFLGAVRHSEVASLIKAFDVFVLASIDTPGWREQFGHVLVEAMAAGTPVIGSDCGAIPEVIGDAGIVFRQGNVEELSKAISLIMNDKEKARRMAEAGRKRVSELFTDEVVARRLFEHWRTTAGVE
jgi:glycosyltransferase involved in cell wall biosynthesis